MVSFDGGKLNIGLHLAEGCSFTEWLIATGIEPHPGPPGDLISWPEALPKLGDRDVWQGRYDQVGGASSSGGSVGVEDMHGGEVKEHEHIVHANMLDPMENVGRGSAFGCGPLTVYDDCQIEEPRTSDCDLHAGWHGDVEHDQMDMLPECFQVHSSGGEEDDGHDTHSPRGCDDALMMYGVESGGNAARNNDAEAVASNDGGVLGEEADWMTDDSGHTLMFETINVTSLNTNATSLWARKSAHVVRVQEHSVDGGAAARIRAEAAKQHRELDLGPTDLEHTRKTGGVGFLTKLPVRSVAILGKTLAYKEAVASGRLMIYELDLAARCMLVAVLYSWTGAEQGNQASERTEDLCMVMLEELEQHDKEPVLVMGDLN